MFFFFFFSSRRRHTRSLRDWSSDVCSSDLFAFSSVAASHDSFATGLPSGRPIFVLPLLRENKTPGCPIQRVLENDFVVVTGTGTARDFQDVRVPLERLVIIADYDRNVA